MSISILAQWIVVDSLAALVLERIRISRGAAGSCLHSQP
jgi:hypothetical protein